MRKIDIAYFAGLFDGEGCVYLYERKGIHKSGNPRSEYVLTVTVVNTNEWICHQLYFSFGGGVYNYPPRGNRQPQWRWKISGPGASDFLKTIYPYTHIKRLQVETGILFQNTKVRRGRTPITDEQKALREAQTILMHKLNKRGRVENA